MFEGLTDLSVTTVEIEKLQKHFISIATPKITVYLGIDMETPPLAVRYDEGESASAELIDEQKTIVLRPLERLKVGKSLDFPAHVTIHELDHIACDEFLDESDES